MKKILEFSTAVALLVVAVNLRPRRIAGFALTPAEKASLRDAPGDIGDTSDIDFKGSRTAGESDQNSFKTTGTADKKKSECDQAFGKWRQDNIYNADSPLGRYFSDLDNAATCAAAYNAFVDANGPEPDDRERGLRLYSWTWGSYQSAKKDLSEAFNSVRGAPLAMADSFKKIRMQNQEALDGFDDCRGSAQDYADGVNKNLRPLDEKTNDNEYKLRVMRDQLCNSSGCKGPFKKMDLATPDKSAVEPRSTAGSGSWSYSYPRNELVTYAAPGKDDMKQHPCSRKDPAP